MLVRINKLQSVRCFVQLESEIRPVTPRRGHTGSGRVNKVFLKAVLTQNVSGVLSGELYVRFSEVLRRHTPPIF